MARKLVFGILTLVVSGIIVFTSLNTGDTYSSAGSELGNWINQVFFASRLNMAEISAIVGFGGKFVGHFSLFALDGVFAYFFCCSFSKNKGLFAAIFILFGIFMSIVGETIQVFIDGRSPTFVDVVIDYSGYLLIPAVITLYQRLNRA